MGLENTPRIRKALVVTLLAALTGGSVIVFAKIALEVFTPFALVTTRFFSATVFMLPFIKRSKELNVKTFRGVLIPAAVGSLNPILLFIALRFTQASVAQLIYASVPAMTAIYLMLIHKQQVTPRRLIGIIIGFIGVSIVVLLPAIQSQRVVGSVFSNFLILLAATAFTAYGLLSKQRQQKFNFSPLALTFYFSLVTFLISVPFTGFELVQNYFLPEIGVKHLLSGIYIGVVGTGIFYMAYQYALKFSSEITASLFTYLQPVAAVILATLLLGERITIPFVIGGSMAVIGAQIASRRNSSI